jgi:hypothetical protein
MMERLLRESQDESNRTLNLAETFRHQLSDLVYQLAAIKCANLGTEGN